MTVGQRIKQRRLELELSQEELAKRLGYKTRAAVCSVEKDKEDLTLDRIRKYAAALMCEPGYLAGWIDTPNGTESPKTKLEQEAAELHERFEHLPADKRESFLKYLKFLESDS